MNWIDEGALYSQIGIFLREDLGRGDLTTQSIIARNTRARGRFIAGEQMIVAGLEAAEEVFLSLDAQLQLEAFASDGEQLEAGKVIARTSGFADVLLAGERVALNLLQHLSGIATLTGKYVSALEGTDTKIVDSRCTSPGLRMLEKYAVLLGGGQSHRFGLDDGVVITANHIQFAGGVGPAVKLGKERQGLLQKIEVQVSIESEVRDALDNGADILWFDNISVAELRKLVSLSKELSPAIVTRFSGPGVTPANVRDFAAAAIDLISVAELTSSARALEISFQIQPY